TVDSAVRRASLYLSLRLSFPYVFQIPMLPQALDNLFRRRGSTQKGGVNYDLWIQRRFIWLLQPRNRGGLSLATSAIGPLLISLLAYLQRADDRHLKKLRNQFACKIAILTTIGSRI